MEKLSALLTDEGAKAIAASVSGNGLSSFSCLKKSPCAEASLIHRGDAALPRSPFPQGKAECWCDQPGADCSLRSQGRPAHTFSSIHRMLEIATQPVFAPSSVISHFVRNATFSTRFAGAKEGRSGRPQALHCAQAVNARRPPGFSPLLRGGEAVSFAD